MKEKYIRDKSIDIVNHGSKATLDFYINVPERQSLTVTKGDRIFKEVIKARAFDESLHRNNEIVAMLNHKRIFADKKDVSAWEDRVGLRAVIETDDIEVLAKILSKDIIGCSFGFKALEEEYQHFLTYTLRVIKKLDLNEVSLIDSSLKPSYLNTVCNHVTIPKTLLNDTYQYMINTIGNRNKRK